MKRILFSFICISAFFLGNVEEAKASHTAGGDITYRYIGDSTGIPFHYEIYLTIYRRDNPGSATLGSSYQVDITSSCGNSSVTVNRFYRPNDSILDDDGVYPRDFAPCVDESAPEYDDHKISQHNYKGTTVLPGKCDYTFSWGLCCRNSNITNLDNPSSHNLYLQSSLNNTLGPNTSAQFLNPGAKSFCTNQQFTWSQAATEPDQDSMRYTLAQPWSGPNTPIPWAPGFSTSQPMTTATGFNFNQSTGLMNFTPSAPEVDVIKFVIEEYRFDTATSMQWHRVGTAIREVQVPVLAQCNELLSEGVAITQGVTVGEVTSTTETHNLDSLANHFGIKDSLTNNPAGNNNTASISVDVIGYNCFDSIVNVKLDGDLKCGTVHHTDFRLIGPDGDQRPVIGVETNCQTTLLTDNIDLQLHKPLDVNGDYLLYVKYGNDGTTIENECGFGVKEFFGVLIRVQNCPVLDYNMENVTVERDEDIRIDWYAVDSTYSRDFFNFWKIWRSKNDGPAMNIAEVHDPAARSYVDSSVSPGELDHDIFTYGVQLIQNQNHYREWTEKLISSIRLTDTMYNDSSGFSLHWTEYNGWDSPMYEVFIGTHDTVADVMNWLSYEGIDSNFYDSEYLFPDEMTADTLGTYYVKVQAYDSLNPSNPYESQSNWIVFELHDPEVEEEDDPDSELVIPNVFTPNGDYQNSTFAIQPGPYGGRDDEIHIAIYNRWGKQVHEFVKPAGTAYDHQHGWDGQDMATGSVVADGVYYYVIQLRDNDSDKIKEVKGHLTIVGGTN